MMKENAMILHIPHSSHYIPHDAKYLLSSDEVGKKGWRLKNEKLDQ